MEWGVKDEITDEHSGELRLRVVIVLRNLEKKELEGTSLKNVTSVSITNSDSAVLLVLQAH